MPGILMYRGEDGGPETGSDCPKGTQQGRAMARIRTQAHVYGVF